MHTTAPDGVRIWWEASEAEGPAVILIPGRGDTSDLYPELFTAVLTAAGHRVIRFDPRDTGLSDEGGDSYTLGTMADDVLVVLDAAGIAAAHVIGLSMGGMIAVDLATRVPARVLSLTFLSAMSPDPSAGFGEHFFGSGATDPLEAMLVAMGAPDDEDAAWVAAELASAIERAPLRPEAIERHMAAALRFGWPEHDRLAAITASTLVVHGTADRLLPVAHARSLESGIGEATLSIVDGMGHLPTRSEWMVIADLVAAHLAAVR